MLKLVYQEIENKLVNDERQIVAFNRSSDLSREDYVHLTIKEKTEHLSYEQQLRVRAEFLGDGPLDLLINDHNITEIMVNSHYEIWIENQGQLSLNQDSFHSELTYKKFLDRLLAATQKVVNREHPFAQGIYRGFRLQYIDQELSPGAIKLCLRRIKETPWRLSDLHDSGWCSNEQLLVLKNILHKKSNFLVVGGTGSGKTSLTGAMLKETIESERTLIIEDTSELPIPNSASLKLLTRFDHQGQLINYSQHDLLKLSLRMRPDRIVMGEMRGEEAKDFLMAIATGHSGCFGTLHAQTPQQALIRLEMLIQMGAPMWSIEAIRRLIVSSLQAICVVTRTEEGHRRLAGIYRIVSLESSGIVVESWV